MRPFTDTTKAIDEPKNARMEQRTKAHVKAAIQEAAALLGVDETTFVTSVAYGRALATIADHQSTALTPEDVDLFMAALDAPANPTDALKAAAKAHAARVQRAD
ncbi:MAG: DUF1778 domain-containing protein [Pseudomonadota bacterium]